MKNFKNSKLKTKLSLLWEHRATSSLEIRKSFRFLPCISCENTGPHDGPSDVLKANSKQNWKSNVFWWPIVLITNSKRSKAPCASSWINRPIPSWLLPLSSLCKTKCMSSVHSFSWKTSHFHVKRFAQPLNLKKRQTATQKWKLSLHKSQEAHQAGAYPGFCSMKRLGVFLLPPG